MQLSHCAHLVAGKPHITGWRSVAVYCSDTDRNKTMPSFDTVCEADFVEVKNAVDNATKEIG
ncbi:MAG: DUF520 family protein, partial [Comamonas sp.]